MRTFCAIAAIAILLSSSVPLAAQHNSQRGAVVGGLGGAIAGSIIGDHNDEAGAGAVIGGALGAVAGAIMGNATDRDAAAMRYQTPSAYGAAPSYQPAYPRGAVSPQDAIEMTRAGLADNVIINHVHQYGVQRPLEVNDIIQLHQQGVREPVISAMQRAQVGSGTGAQASAPAPVIVQPQYHVAPSYIVPVEPAWYPHYYHHHHFHPRHHHSSVRFSFGF